MPQTLSKEERLSGKTAVGDLLKKGRWGFTADLKYCWLYPGSGECNKVLVSVPKRNFKRAVKRNLLKRRLRESYRTRKELLTAPAPVDLMLFYNSKEVLESSVILAEVEEVLRSLTGKLSSL